MALLFLILVACFACWIVSLLPLPSSASPFIRNFLYILIAALCIAWLLDLGGYIHFGVYRPFR